MDAPRASDVFNVAKAQTRKRSVYLFGRVCSLVTAPLQWTVQCVHESATDRPDRPNQPGDGRSPSEPDSVILCNIHTVYVRTQHIESNLNVYSSMILCCIPLNFEQSEIIAALRHQIGAWASAWRLVDKRSPYSLLAAVHSTTVLYTVCMYSLYKVRGCSRGGCFIHLRCQTTALYTSYSMYIFTGVSRRSIQHCILYIVCVDVYIL